MVEVVCADTKREKRLWQRFALHREAYYRIRAKVPELGAQLTCNAIRAVSAAYKSFLSNNPKYVKNKEEPFPKIIFKNVGIHLDARTLTFSSDRKNATIFTTQKRVTVRLCPGNYQQDILDGGK